MAGLGEIVHRRLTRDSGRLACRFIHGADVREITAGDLLELAGAVGRRLKALDLPARSRVGVARYSGPGLHAAWLGALWAGHIPSMVAPPSPRMEAAKYAAGLSGIVRGLRLGAIVTDESVAEAIGSALPATTRLVITEEAERGRLEDIAQVGPDEIAVVQHTSGTTGQQKAVALSTTQILEHQHAYARRLGLGPADRIVSWLPLYHDMGFVAAFLQPLLTGTALVELSPFEWANDPAQLLRAIDAHRPTLCWMPNFAFKLLAEPRVTRGVAKLDLSSMRMWINCSEPVMSDSFDSFAAALGRFGVRPQSLTASYAMAENVFAVTQSLPGEGPARLNVDRLALERDCLAHPPADGLAAVSLVSSGALLPTTELQVRAEDGLALPDGQVGEFWLRGRHRFVGYHERPDLTAQALDGGGWYATGDLGFTKDGELYVTGRKKDLIILRGRNYSAHEIERAVEALPGVKPGRVVAFSVPDAAIGTERLIVLAECEAGARASDGDLALQVRKCVAQTFDATVSDVRFVPDRWLVKSTSGKLARAGNRAKYLEAWGG